MFSSHLLQETGDVVHLVVDDEPRVAAHVVRLDLLRPVVLHASFHRTAVFPDARGLRSSRGRVSVHRRHTLSVLT